MKRRRFLASGLLLLLIVIGAGWHAYGRWQDEQLRRYMVGKWRVVIDPAGPHMILRDDGLLVGEDSSRVSTEIVRWYAEGSCVLMTGPPFPAGFARAMIISIVDADHCKISPGTVRPIWSLKIGTIDIPFFTRLQREEGSLLIERMPLTTLSLDGPNS